jgi:hypothetical protein
MYNFNEDDGFRGEYRFHGGCSGCTRQKTEPEGVDYCINCQHFMPDWNLSDLNNRPPTPTELKREELIQKYSLKRSK